MNHTNFDLFCNILTHYMICAIIFISVKIQQFLKWRNTTMEKSCVANFCIQLSDDASKIPFSKNKLITFIRTFRDFSRKRAVETLFRLKYGTNESKKEALEWFECKQHNFFRGITESQFIQVLDFSEEEIALLLNELCIQYEAKDPDFLSIYSIKGLPATSCQEELNALQSRMSDSPLLFFLVVKKCVKERKNPYASKIIIQLLSNDTTANIFGLESLGFDFNYRILLKDFSNEIGTLLLAMYQQYSKNVRLLERKDDFTLPLATLLSEMQASGDDSTTTVNEIEFFKKELLKFVNITTDVTPKSPSFSFCSEYQSKLMQLGKKTISLINARNEYKNVFAEKKDDGLLWRLVTSDASLGKTICTLEQECNIARAAYAQAMHEYQGFIKKHDIH